VPTRKTLALFVVTVLVNCSQATTAPFDLAAADLPLPLDTVLAPAQTTTRCLAVDAGAVYWVDDGGGTARVMKVALTGGNAAVLASGGDVPGCAVVDGGNVFYTDGDTLRAVPASGAGAPTAVATGQNFLNRRLFAFKGYVYWITDVYGAVDAFNGKNAIVRTHPGGTVEVMFVGLDGSGLLYVDDTNFYYSDRGGTFAQPRAGTAAPVSFGFTSASPSPFGVDATHLVMVEISAPGQGDLAAFRLDGMGKTFLSSQVVSVPLVDGSFVYANLSGHLAQFASDGSTSRTLAYSGPRAIAVDANAIYFTDGASIQRVVKTN
jgi:hypothetical protein